jgi:Ca2+:H+ antiporter
MGRVLNWNHLTVFTVNFLAILPMANMQFYAVEAVTLHVSPLVGGLIDAFLGKSVEQVMAIQCLRAGLSDVLKGNLMGSMHWCLLLVLGMSIFAAGTRHKTTKFNVQGASAQMTCQVVASIGIALPTMYGELPGVDAQQVLFMSRACSFGLISLYMCFIFFHLISHTETFHTSKSADEEEVIEEEEEKPDLSFGTSLFLMIFSITVTSLNSQVLVDNIKGVCHQFHVPKEFIGGTLLPILGNTAEHIASVRFALHDDMDFAILLAVNSATQIALFVVPLSVLWGWAFDEPMSLKYRTYDAAVMLLATFLCAQVLQHGASNWLHGAMLMTVYLLIAIINFFLPVEE